MRRLLPLVMAFSVAACAARQSQVEFRPRAGTIGPFSEAVRVDGLLFLSGVIGTDSTGRLAEGGIGPETQQALENIRAVLARNGVGMDRVVKCTVFLADIAEWGAMNRVYATFFPTNRPARTAVGGAGVVRNGRVEIDCIAAVD